MKKINNLWQLLMLLAIVVVGSLRVGAQTTIYEDDFATLSTSTWTIEGGDRWRHNSSQGNPKPSVMFLSSSSTAESYYNQTLTSKSFSGAGKEVILLDFDLSLKGGGLLVYGNITVEELLLHVYDGENWNLIHTFTDDKSLEGWNRFSFDISRYAAGKDFKIRFTAVGEEISFLTNRGIDNMKIHSPANVGTVSVNVTNYPASGNGIVRLEGINNLAYVEVMNGKECSFTKVPTGSYKLVVDVDGYALQMKDVEVVAGSNPQTITLSNAGGCVAINDLAISSKMGMGVGLSWTATGVDDVMGYRVYRNGEILERLVNDNGFVDIVPNVAEFKYRVRSVYKDGKVSDLSNEVVFNSVDVTSLPFFEDFSLKTFDANGWVKTPVKNNNWHVTTDYGNSAPAAQFGMINRLKGYDNAFQTPVLNGKLASDVYLCYDVYFKRNALQGDPSLEELWVDVYDGEKWIEVAKYDNRAGDFEFLSCQFDLTDKVVGKDFSVRFSAKGQFGGRVTRWLIDNVKVYSPAVGSMAGVVKSATIPLSGVDVTFTNKENGFGFTTTSSNDGAIQRAKMEAGVYRVEATYEGYCVYDSEITINPGSNNIELLMVSPVIDVVKTEYEVVTYPGGFVRQEVEIGNSGDGLMTWQAVVNAKEIEANGEAKSANWSVAKAFDVKDKNESIATDGTNIYVSTKTSSTIDVYTMDYEYKESFKMTGVTISSLKDMAYDGKYFYGGNGTSNKLFELDLANRTYVSTITLSSTIKVVHCTYDEKQDAFWVGDASSLYLVNRAGEVIVDKITVDNVSGSAYDEYTKGGPYLWLFTQTSLPEVGIDNDKVTIRQFDLATKTLTGVVHSATDLPGYQNATSGKATLAGGLFGTPLLSNGRFVLMGVVLQTPPKAFAYDIKTMTSWILLNDEQGTIPAGGTAKLTLDIDADEFAAGESAVADLKISTSNPDVGEKTIKINLSVEGVRMNPPKSLIAIVNEPAEGSDNKMSVELSWELPDSQIPPVGYNVYSKGIKVNQSEISELKYSDVNPTLGSMCYSVTAVYDGLGESRQSEEKCVFVYSEGGCKAPWRLVAAQESGRQNVSVKWISPLSDLCNMQWHNDTPKSGIGLSKPGTMYVGTKFEPSDLPETGEYYINEIQNYFYQKPSIASLIIYQDDVEIYKQGVAVATIQPNGMPTKIAIEGGLKLDKTKSLMIVFAAVQASNEKPFFMDVSSKTINGKGNLTSVDGKVWTTMSDANIAGNWATTIMLRKIEDGKQEVEGSMKNLSANCTAVEFADADLNDMFVSEDCEFNAEILAKSDVAENKELAGYNVYRDGIKVNTGLVTLSNFVDKTASAGEHIYSVRAVYSDGCLSEESNEETVNVKDYSILPFWESFESNDLFANGWDSEPSIGSMWQVQKLIGNPAPGLRFSSTTLKNYNQYVTTRELSGEGLKNVYLSYDLSCYISLNEFTEFLYVELLVDDKVIEVTKFDFKRQMNYEKQLVDISEHVLGKKFRVRYRAAGIDAARSTQWVVDNISIGEMFFSDVNIKVTANSTPVAEASVYLVNNEQFKYKGVTDVSGNLSISKVLSGKYNVRIEKEGFNTLYKKIDVVGTIPINNHNLTMETHGTCDGPANLKKVKVVGCAVHLAWNNLSANPVRLYKIYRNGVVINGNASTNNRAFLDIVPQEGVYKYEVRAEFENGCISKASNELSIEVKDLNKLPFFEDFEYSSFLPHSWTTIEGGDRWSCPSNGGHPAPGARFGFGNNVDLKNYEVSLTSKEFLVEANKDIMLMFDMQFVSRNLNTDEYLSVEVSKGEKWVELIKFHNKTAVLDTYQYHVARISDAVTESKFKIRFRAHGEDAANIFGWYIDNVTIKNQKLGTLSGKVSDSKGIAISDATVSIKNTAQNIVATTKSDNMGNYKISNIVAGNHDITVVRESFSDFKSVKDLKVEANTLNITMHKPEAKITPANLAITVPYTSVSSKIVEIENIGEGILTWILDEGTDSNSWISIGTKSGQVLSGKKQAIRIDMSSVGFALGEVKTGKYAFKFNSGQTLELNVTMTVESTPEECNAPMYFTAKQSGIENIVKLDWKDSHIPNETVNLKWHDDKVAGTVGLGTQGGTFYIGAKWNQTDLKYYEGYKLSEVTVYINDYADIEIQAYQDGNLILSQVVAPLDVKLKEFNTIVIKDGGVKIDVTKELIVGYKAVQATSILIGKYPAGRDSGPAVEGKGNLFSADGKTWTTLSAMGINANWYLTAKIVKAEDGKDKIIAPTTIVDKESIVNADASQLSNIEQLSFDSPIYNSRAEQTIVGYNVYRDGTVVNKTPIATTSFIDNEVTYGVHEYYATTLWSHSCESKPSNKSDVLVSNNYKCVAPASITAKQKAPGSLIGNIKWTEPTDEYLVKWWEDTKLNAVGLGAASNMYCAAKWTTEDLYDYNMYTVDNVQIALADGTKTLSILIYQDGLLIHEQAVKDSDLKPNDITMVKLNKQIVVDASKALMIGYRLFVPANKGVLYTEGVGGDKGAFLSTNGSAWTTLNAATGGKADGNWIISAVLSLKTLTKSGSIPLTDEKIVLTNHKINVQSITNSSKVLLNAATPTIPGLMGYKLYRNDELLNNDGLLTANEYSDEVSTFAEYTYYVKAVYKDGCESIESKRVKINYVPVGVNEAITDDGQVYPNPCTDKLTVKGQYSKVSILSITGKLMDSQEMNSSELSIDMSKYPSGVYFIRCENSEYTVNRKIIKK